MVELTIQKEMILVESISDKVLEVLNDMYNSALENNLSVEELKQIEDTIDYIENMNENN